MKVESLCEKVMVEITVLSQPFIVPAWMISLYVPAVFLNCPPIKTLSLAHIVNEFAPKASGNTLSVIILILSQPFMAPA